MMAISLLRGNSMKVVAADGVVTAEGPKVVVDVPAVTPAVLKVEDKVCCLCPYSILKDGILVLSD
jgi:hypothetical protein